MKNKIQLAVLFSIIASNSYAQANNHPTADEFSRFIVAGVKYGATQANPTKGACLSDIGDNVLSEIAQELITSNFTSAEIRKFDSFHGSDLGRRWTDDKILYGMSGGTKHGKFTALELDQIARVADSESGLKLQGLVRASNPAIRDAIREALTARAPQCK